MSNTLHEWYRMLWEQNAQIIVCVTPLESSSECAEYFKLKKGKTVKVKMSFSLIETKEYFIFLFSANNSL